MKSTHELTFLRGQVFESRNHEKLKTAKASRNKKERSNKERTTRTPLDKRIGVRNMDINTKTGKKVQKDMQKWMCTRSLALITA